MQRLTATPMRQAVANVVTAGRGSTHCLRSRFNSSASQQVASQQAVIDTTLSGSEIRMLGYARNQRRADLAAKELQEQCGKSSKKFHITGLKTYKSFTSVSGNCEHFQTKLDAALQAQDCPEAVRLAVSLAARDTEREALVASDAQVDGVKGYLCKMNMFDQVTQSDISGFVVGAEFTPLKPERRRVGRQSLSSKGILWRKEIAMLEDAVGWEEVQTRGLKIEHGISRSDLEATMAVLESKASECAIRKTRKEVTVPMEISPEEMAAVMPEDSGRDKWNIIMAFLVDANMRVLHHRVTRFEGGQGLWSVKQLLTLAYYNARSEWWQSTAGTRIKDLPFFSKGWGVRLSPFLGD